MSRLVIAVDPGKATGVAFFELASGQDSPVLLKSLELQPNEFAPAVRSMMDEAYGRAESEGVEVAVVCERFTINAQTVRNSQAPFSLEQIGVLKQILRDRGLPDDGIYWQSPADAKTMFPNPAIKKVGVWHKGGEGHALDAIRHGLLFLAKHGWKPLALLS